MFEIFTGSNTRGTSVYYQTLRHLVVQKCITFKCWLCFAAWLKTLQRGQTWNSWWWVCILKCSPWLVIGWAAYTDFYSPRCIPLSNSLRRSRSTLLAGCAAPLDWISQGRPRMATQCESGSILKPHVSRSAVDWICTMGKMYVYTEYSKCCAINSYIFSEQTNMPSEINSSKQLFGLNCGPARKAIFF